MAGFWENLGNAVVDVGSNIGNNYAETFGTDREREAEYISEINRQQQENIDLRKNQTLITFQKSTVIAIVAISLFAILILKKR